MENVEHIKLLDLADPKRIKETVNTLIDLHNQVNVDVRDIATTAAITANRAKTTADTANGTATEALAKSNTALQQSEDALQNSEDAVQVSEIAVQQANAAVNTANQAAAQSTTALQVSETADTNSTNALQQAQTAVTTAATALETVTNTEQKVEQALKTVENAATKEDIQEAIAEIPVPDVSGQIQAHNEDSDAHPDMRRAIAEFKTIQELDTDRINIYELANGIYTFKDKEEMQYTLYYTPLYQVTPFPITRAGCLLFIGDQIVESYVAGESSPTRYVVNNYALLFNGVGNIYYGYASNGHGGSAQEFEFDTSRFVTKSVNDLVNYYTKTEVYTQAEVDTLLQELSGIDPENLMEKTNPVATGSFSLNRKRLSTTGDYSSTLGYDNTASGMYAHAEGYLTNATADRAHSEGNRTTASGLQSHAEGASTTASGGQSHAEGYNTVASSTNAHAEGNYTKATGSASHAEGSYSEASGSYSHAEGASSKASGDYSHAEGLSTKATHRSQHVFGEYNEQDHSTNSATSRGHYVEIVGNGTSSSPSNARTLDWNGNEVLSGNVTATGFKTPNGTSSQFLKADGSAVEAEFVESEAYLEPSVAIDPFENYYTKEEVETNYIKKDELLDYIHPILSYYESDDPTDPGILFGGVWEKVEGVFMLSSNSNHLVGTQGGSETHTNTLNYNDGAAAIRNYGNTLYFGEGASNVSSMNGAGLKTWGYTHNNDEEKTSGYSGVGLYGKTGEGSSMPPYKVTNRWQRIA